MSTLIHLAPSILGVKEENLDSVISQLNKIPYVNYLHIDVMDGEFVPQKTIYLDPANIRRLRDKTHIPLDVHLMVAEPEKYVDAFADAGASMFTFHHEATRYPTELIDKIHRRDMSAGMALNPNSPMNTMYHLLDNLELVLLMSVNPGKGGQAYLNHVTDRIRTMRSAIDSRERNTLISVDGGINLDNRYLPINAGANTIVSGSGLFSEGDLYSNIRKMKDLVLLCSDHGGYRLKEELKTFLNSEGYAYHDLGTHSEESCDYPDIAQAAAPWISAGLYKFLVACCGTGIGISVQFNRYPNVIAAPVYSKEVAKLAREHNDLNVPCFGERTMDWEDSKKRLKICLETPFSGEPRHARRIAKIEDWQKIK